MSDSEDAVDQPVASGSGTAQGFPSGQQAMSREVKLPAYWPSRPAAWFQLAESRFRLKNVTDPQLKYDYLLSSLSDEVIGDVLDVLEEAAGVPDPYEHLKERMLETHVLSNFEKLELLFKTEPMGGRKPSQLLAAMLQYCPPGEEKGLFFHFMFLQRLPVALRAMLGDVEHGDPRALAAKADRLLSLNPIQSTIAAAVEPVCEETTVAAVSFPRGGRGRGLRGNPLRGRGSGASRGAAGAGGVSNGGGGKQLVSPHALAKDSAGLCFYHWNFGDNASKCRPPCSWQGN